MLNFFWPFFLIGITVVTGSGADYSDQLTATVIVGDGPYGIAVTPDGSYAYVTNFSGNTVSVIRTFDNVVVGGPIAVGDGPWVIAVNPSGDFVYAVNHNDDTVSVLERPISEGNSGSVPVGPLAAGVSALLAWRKRWKQA